MDITADVAKLATLKTKVEEHEAQRARANAKIEALMEQAGKLYGVSSLEGLRELLAKKEAEVETLGQKIRQINDTLDKFFAGV